MTISVKKRLLDIEEYQQMFEAGNPISNIISSPKSGKFWRFPAFGPLKCGKGGSPGGVCNLLSLHSAKQDAKKEKADRGCVLLPA